MNTEEKQAYDWALKQDFQSVAARYARTLVKYIEKQSAIPPVKDVERVIDEAAFRMCYDSSFMTDAEKQESWRTRPEYNTKAHYKRQATLAFKVFAQSLRPAPSVWEIIQLVFDFTHIYISPKEAQEISKLGRE